MTVDNL